jgi:hypothetical protein
MVLVIGTALPAGSFELAGFSPGVVARLKYVEGEVSMASATETVDVSFKAPVPLLGADFHMGLLADILEARVLVTGIGYSGNNILDDQADVSLTPIPFVDINAGCRLLYMNAEGDDINFDFGTDGPFVGVTISF